MALNTNKKRLVFAGQSSVCGLACLLFVIAMSSTVQASIESPQPAAIEFKQLQAQPSSGMTTGSSSLNALPSGPSDDDSQANTDRTFETSVIPSGSSSGTTSPSGGAGTSTVLAFGAISAATFSDTGLICWFSGEQCLALPMPPGNDLLRPPRTV